MLFVIAGRARRQWRADISIFRQPSTLPVPNVHEDGELHVHDALQCAGTASDAVPDRIQQQRLACWCSGDFRCCSLSIFNVFLFYIITFNMYNLYV